MKHTLKGTKYLASLAVFRVLYDSEKDIYGIISEFILQIIISKSKYSFNLTEITYMLNNTYDFNIPEAVVKPSLKRLNFLTKVHGNYSVNNLSELQTSNINEKKEKIQENNEKIIRELFEFIEKSNKIILNEKQKGEIVHSFCSFLLDNSNGGRYSEYISAYLIKNKRDSNFKKQLNTIKEGVVLYTGIKYNNNINDVGSWNCNLTIYIETEILFRFAGYDGELHKMLFDDFYSYVKEINRNKPNLIKLKYFREVDKEIGRFFNKAEEIVEGKELLAPKGTAMASIVNGCNSKSDVIEKKVDFFQLLQTSGIKKDNYDDYFNEKNHKYNIDDKTVKETVSKSLEIENIDDYLKFLNYISIHRKQANENNFDNIKYILLSGNHKTLNVAWHKEIKKGGNVPLATDLSFLTNKFWFKLNKGFGKNRYPKSFDIITKAQIILSTQLNESVGKKFDELQVKFKDGELTEEQAKATIIELRKQMKKPEEIKEEDISSILDSISEDSIEVFLKEQEHFKNMAHKETEENTLLKNDLRQKENEIEEHKKSRKALASEVINTKDTLLKEKLKRIQRVENQKKPIDIKIANSYRFFKIRIAATLILLYSLACFLIWKCGWNEIEPWTWIIGVIPPIVISFLYMLFKEKTLNPIQILNNKKKDIQKDKYKKFNLDVSLLDRLKSETNELSKEIDKLKQIIIDEL